MRLTIVAAFVLAVLLPARAADQLFGGLYLTSLPESADVWVDGTYVGRTPAFIDGLHEGKHAVTIAKAGWKVTELDEDVAAGATTARTIQLQRSQPGRDPGKVALHGLAADAKVSFDGGPWQGLSQAFAQTPGIHHVVVRESGAKFLRMTTVYPGETTHLVFPVADSQEHSAVVAAVGDYIPETAAKVTNGRIYLKWAGHIVTGKIGEAQFMMDRRSVTYDAAAGMVRGKLYLPLELILAITGKK
ncbi:MAG: PEGA domain-containing protein [Candidatus Eremiobacteraeota bacterium]|nr:PEGA domain-containing protein [Candidatus Eremiobacteraeota bacterium]